MTQEMFHESGVLRDLAEKAQQDHVDRLDGPAAEKLVPRPYRPRKRPKTAIIAIAAQKAIAKREARERFQQEVLAWITSARPSDEAFAEGVMQECEV